VFLFLLFPFSLVALLLSLFSFAMLIFLFACLSVDRFQSWGVQLCNVKGDKVARALACQPSFSQEMIYAPARDWSDMVIDEMAVFPLGKYKDLTDSSTQAIKYARDVGLLPSDEEVKFAEQDRVTHRSKPRPLYPV